eukprot:9986879-Ditylum_brightwellii.AAC.1
MLGMSHDCFIFIWRQFHVQSNFEHYQGDVEEDEGGSNDEDYDEYHLEDYVEQHMERVYREEEYDHQDDSSVDLSDLEDGDDNDECGDITSVTSDEEDITGVEDKMGVPPSSEAQRDNIHEKGKDTVPYLPHLSAPTNSTRPV